MLIKKRKLNKVIIVSKVKLIMKIVLKEINYKY